MMSTGRILVFVSTLMILLNIASCYPNTTPNKSEKSNFIYKVTERFGVTHIETQEIDCQELRDSGEYCPYSPNYKGDLSTIASQTINKRSSTPWFNYMTYDSRRTPQYIPTACCACYNCVRMVDGVAHPNVDMYSYPVSVGVDVEVERRNYKPLLKTIKNPVGCTCSQAEYRRTADYSDNRGFLM